MGRFTGAAGRLKDVLVSMTSCHRAHAIFVGRFAASSPWRAWNRREDQQDRVWYQSLSQGDEIRGAAMTGPEHYRRAEELAAEAHRLLGQGDGQATASAWAAVAQAHAVLALAATTAVGASGADSRAWPEPPVLGSAPATQMISSAVCALRMLASRPAAAWLAAAANAAGSVATAAWRPGW